MLLLKVFEDHAGHGPSIKPSPLYKDMSSRSTILDSITLPPSTMPSTTPSSSMSTNNLHASAASGEFLHPKYLPPSHRQQNISSPSSPSSPSLSATSSAVSSTLLHHQRQQQEQLLQQQQLQEAFMFSTDQMHHPSLLMGSSEAEKSSDREEIWIIALGFGGAYTCLVTLLARFKWIPGLEKTGAG